MKLDLPLLFIRLSYGVRTAPVCSRIRQHLCARDKSKAVAAIPSFGHRKILHTPTRMGSAAPAAAVPYPGKRPEFPARDNEVLKQNP